MDRPGDATFREVARKRIDQRYAVLTLEGRGIYETLMDECRLCGSIPSKPEDVADLIGYPPLLFPQHWRTIKKFFVPDLSNKERLISVEVEADRRRRDLAYQHKSRAGKLGGQRSAIVRATQNKEDRSSASSSAQAHSSTKDPFPQQFSNPVVGSIPQEGERRAAAPTPPPPAAKPTRRPRSRAKVEALTPSPERYEVTDDLRQFALREHIAIPDLQAEVDACLDHFRAKGILRADWLATIKNWLRKIPKFGFGAAVNQEPLLEVLRGAQQPRESAEQAKQRRTAEAGERILARLASQTGGGLPS